MHLGGKDQPPPKCPDSEVRRTPLLATLLPNFGIERTLCKFIILVWFLDLKLLYECAAEP